MHGHSASNFRFHAPTMRREGTASHAQNPHMTLTLGGGPPPTRSELASRSLGAGRCRPRLSAAKAFPWSDRRTREQPSGWCEGEVRVLYVGGASNEAQPASVRNRKEHPVSPQSVNPEQANPPSGDQRAADYDQPYTWGRPPTTYLMFRQVVRLMILRSRLETVRCERVGPGAVAAELNRSSPASPCWTFRAGADLAPLLPSFDSDRSAFRSEDIP